MGDTNNEYLKKFVTARVSNIVTKTRILNIEKYKNHLHLFHNMFKNQLRFSVVIGSSKKGNRYPGIKIDMPNIKISIYLKDGCICTIKATEEKIVEKNIRKVKLFIDRNLKKNNLPPLVLSKAVVHTMTATFNYH